MTFWKRQRARECSLALSLATLCGVQSGLERDAAAQLPLDVLARKHPRFAERVLTPLLNAGKPARFVVRRDGRTLALDMVLGD